MTTTNAPIRRMDEEIANVGVTPQGNQAPPNKKAPQGQSQPQVPIE